MVGLVKRHLAVRLEDEQIRKFRKKCIEDEITQAEVISLLIDEYLNGYLKIKKPSPKLVRESFKDE